MGLLRHLRDHPGMVGASQMTWVLIYIIMSNSGYSDNSTGSVNFTSEGKCKAALTMLQTKDRSGELTILGGCVPK